MISSVPFALQNGSHSAALFRQAVSSIVPNGGGLVQAGDLAVTQTGTPSMGVVVGVGRAWVPGTNVANFSGTTYSSQAQYFALNDGPVTLTINAADPTNPRIDVVCLTVNDSNYSGTTNSAVLQVITGTPAASPTAPAAPANSLVLAQVSVAANATSITNSNITTTSNPSISPFPSLTHMEINLGQVGANTANTDWGPGTPSQLTGAIDTTRSFNTSNFSFPANDQIQVTSAGIYAVSWKLISLPSGASGFQSFQWAGKSNTYAMSTFPAVSSAYSGQAFLGIPAVYLPANGIIQFVYQTSVAATPGHTLRVTRLR